MARLIETTIEATGTTEGVDIHGEATLNMSFGASVAEIQVERKGPWGTFQPFGDPFIGDAAEIITERIHGVQYRLNCTSFTSGSIPVELGDK